MAQLTLYNDYSSKKRKKRCRLMLVPGSAATYVPVLEPEWGEDPAPTSTFRKCPAFTILENANNGKTAFDALPTGMSTKAGRNVGINLSRMSTGDLLTARDAITSLTINTGTLSTVGSGPSIDLPNQWILLEGDVGDDIADFDVVFHGIQVPTRKREFDAVPNQRVEMSFECMHICEFISRMVHPTWVEERVADVGTLESDGQLFLHLWKEGTELLSQTAIPEENLPAISTTSRFRFRKMTHVAFYGIVMDIMNECYQFLTRQTRSTSTKSFALRSFRSAPVASGGVGMPIDRGGFFKQDHTKANAAGAIISRDNTKLIAYVIDTDNSDVVVAGQLSDGDGGRLDFESMWEWFDLECKSSGSRGEY